MKSLNWNFFGHVCKLFTKYSRSFTTISSLGLFSNGLLNWFFGGGYVTPTSGVISNPNFCMSIQRGTHLLCVGRPIEGDTFGLFAVATRAAALLHVVRQGTHAWPADNRGWWWWKMYIPSRANNILIVTQKNPAFSTLMIFLLGGKKIKLWCFQWCFFSIFQSSLSSWCLQTSTTINKTSLPQPQKSTAIFCIGQFCGVPP